jgi:hypothetical protein
MEIMTSPYCTSHCEFWTKLGNYGQTQLKHVVEHKVTISIPALYDYTRMHFLSHLFLHMFRTIPEGAMNVSA